MYVNTVIALDAMGGDNAPFEIVKGAVEAVSQYDIKLILIGKENLIQDELKKYSFEHNKIEVVHANEIISNDESPTTAIRKKKDSSVVVGLNLVKEGKAMAFVSAGSTGAILTGSTFIIGRIRGIERPALATVLPNTKGFSFLIDCGANVDSKPTYLVQFAKMGAVYVENILGIKNPRVGLLNIGAEKEKGNTLTKEAYELLEQEKDIHFIGNIEARDVSLGGCDVVVADAFAGNVLLKATEGVSQAVFSIIKTELMSSTVSKIGALILKKSFKNIKQKMDYSEYGGAPFLGLKSLVVKAHGSSDAKAIKNAIRQCVDFINSDIVAKIEQNIQVDVENEK